MDGNSRLRGMEGRKRERGMEGRKEERERDRRRCTNTRGGVCSGCPVPPQKYITPREMDVEPPRQCNKDGEDEEGWVEC